KITDQGLVEDSSRMTIVKERMVSARQQMLRIDFEDTHPLSASIEKGVLKQIEDEANGAQFVIVQDYAKCLLSPDFCLRVIEKVRELGKRVILDPNPKSNLGMYRGVYLLTPNKKEAEKLTGI